MCSRNWWGNIYFVFIWVGGGALVNVHFSAIIAQIFTTSIMLSLLWGRHLRSQTNIVWTWKPVELSQLLMIGIMILTMVDYPPWPWDKCLAPTIDNCVYSVTWNHSNNVHCTVFVLCYRLVWGCRLATVNDSLFHFEGSLQLMYFKYLLLHIYHMFLKQIGFVCLL